MTKKRRNSGNKKAPTGRSPWPLALLFRLALIVAAGMLALSYLSVFINPSVVSFPLFFGLYFIPILLINILLLILGMFRRSGATWITFFALLPSLLFADMFINWGESKKEEEGLSLKIMTYNVGMFAHPKGLSREEVMKKIAGYAEDNNPDIICFQEFYIKDTGVIRELYENYPHRSCHFYKLKSGSRFGNLTLSRFPIKESGKITFKGSTNLCIYSDIDHYGRDIRIYNTHLESHSISFTSLVKRISNSDKMSDELVEVHDKMANTFKRRSRQVDTIATHSSAGSIPAVICGDFNDTPMSYTYHILSKGREDSFRESGKGMSATYGSLWPMLRIDYILYPDGWWAMSHKTPKISWSDHYPVIAELIIP